MNDHKGERRLPGFILTAKLLQRVVQRRQVCNRRLAEHKLATSPDSVSSEANLEPKPSFTTATPYCIRAVSVPTVQAVLRTTRGGAGQAIERMKQPVYTG